MSRLTWSRSDAVATASLAFQKRLLLFGVGRLEDMLKKGNVWYVRHYERYFDEVVVAYLLGRYPDVVAQGKTRLVSLGTRTHGSWIDLLCAPWRLYRLARRVRPTSYLTADIVFSWWTSVLVRIFQKAKIVLLPVCMPEEIYKNSKRSLSGLPIAMERFLTNLSFRSACRVIMGANSEALIAWLRTNTISAGKLKVVRATVEDYPPLHFYTDLEGKWLSGVDKRDVAKLLYVGRLHPEKHVMDLVEMMAHLRARQVAVELHVAGDGLERARMEERIEELNLRDYIVMHGFVPSEQLPALYKTADAFVSPLTGTALREAGLMGLPIVAYDMDWVSDLLEDGKTGLLAEPGNPESLAIKVEQIVSRPDLRRRIAEAFRDEARRRWALQHIEPGLEEAFGDLA